MHRFRTILTGLFLTVAFAASGCDSSGSGDEVRLTVTPDGTGTGAVLSRTVGIVIQCQYNDGVAAGICETSFLDSDQLGNIRLAATPATTSEREWTGACRNEDSNVCELTPDASSSTQIDVGVTFSAKTVIVLMTPASALITTLGEEGALVVAAQALDKDGLEVLGVTYVWDVEDPGILSVVQSDTDPRRATITALSNGSSVVTATAQNVIGRAAVDIGSGG